jgi:sec-independent protein translocase protein TatA
MGLFDSPSHILIVLVVLVLLFGSAKLPKLAKSLGESMRIFKGEAAKLQDDDKPTQAQVQAPVQQQPLPAPPPVQAQQPVVAPQPVQQPVQDPQHTNQAS